MEPEDEIRAIIKKIKEGHSVSPEDVAYLRGIDQSRATAKVVSLQAICFRYIDDPANAPWLESALYLGDAEKAKQPLWALAVLGRAGHYKAYIHQAVEPGFAWDSPGRHLGWEALSAAGWHLRTHRDRDFARLIARWATKGDDDPPHATAPFDLRSGWHSLANAARVAAGYAVGADPLALTNDEGLIAACVARFVAERQDG